MITKKNISFLEAYYIKQIHVYEKLQELTVDDFHIASHPKPCEKAKQAARLANEYCFDGGIFFGIYDAPTSSSALENLSKRIETIPQIIAEMEKPTNRSSIPNNTELLTIPQVARILGWGESVVRERNKKGLMPLPIRIGGSIQWRKQELQGWLNAGCPTRQNWEQQKGGA